MINVFTPEERKKNLLVQQMIRNWDSVQHTLYKGYAIRAPAYLQQEQEQIQWQVVNGIMPIVQNTLEYLNQGFLQDYEGDKGYLHVLWADKFAMVLLWGLFAKDNHHARLTLFNLLQSSDAAVQVAATLALIYNGESVHNINPDKLRKAIELRVFEQIPIKVYREALSGLTKVFQQNPPLVNELLGRIRYIEPREKENETLLFIFNVAGSTDREVIKRIMDRIELNTIYIFNDQEAQEVQRFRSALARTLMANKHLLRYVADRIQEKAEDGRPPVEINAWLSILSEIDPNKASPEIVMHLISILENAKKDPMSHVPAVKCLVRFANQGSQRTQVRQLILKRLKSTDTEVVYRTLQGIWELQDVDDIIYRQVLKLAKKRKDVKAPAIETLGKWRVYRW